MKMPGGFAMFQKKMKKETYDKENERPLIRASICNGEQIAGFKNIHTGKFTEVMVIRNSRDMDEFLEKYDIAIAEMKKEY